MEADLVTGSTTALKKPAFTIEVAPYAGETQVPLKYLKKYGMKMKVLAYMLPKKVQNYMISNSL